MLEKQMGSTAYGGSYCWYFGGFDRAEWTNGGMDRRGAIHHS